ncbi:tyrosine-type recombinase/integrase [Anaerobacillus isosaccharinicus]|uniref:Integrase n=1 Tax=Anaerobacillus isosaccharinicus TaxID=1532552 RepID=A0A1S2M6X8_9BACI|nr:tyrosine-type recombinase/integrase [Anaerobacillus isosaccharinicus]MBA5583993.1 tyrosine-type recombinase/integrase [Anaerobacillus isosaccharinicus]MBA5585011.1 tyrosine-type recombinase/integrase [Anaerobacillus isosaccharinicus]MBA5587039.1 tyrosine-type recombinase/integrase [Anaerobacillus isosaccharinicus]MBA5587096.1 tyrosine-type recombinase/integrase [Anaerobacillus isosaccharinicus]QOY34708.1 tyrosine-type recombinase/integrase [Anaerobacillus isosaccharinicus]
MKQTNFARTLTRFLSDYLPSQRNVSTNTIKSYRDTFKQILTFCDLELKIKPEFLNFEILKVETIKAFLNWLEKTRMVGVNTRNQRLAAIHSFFRYTQSEHPEIMFECQKVLGIPFKKREKKSVQFLSQESLKFILEQPDTSKIRGRRDLTIMATLYDTGARVQELIDLKIQDVRLSKPATITLTGKGNKRRSVPIMERTRNIIESYLKENRLLDNGKQGHPLFYNSNKKPFTRPGITYILEKYLNLAKKSHPEVLYCDNLHPHLVRHTKAMHLLEAGVNLIYIRDLLGHVNVSTTEVYLRANTETKRKVLEAAYMEVVTQDIPVWDEDKDLLNWLRNFCR